MHPKVITQRGKAAEGRLKDALASLAGTVGVTPTVPANSRDSDLRAVFVLEALATTAEDIVNFSSVEQVGIPEAKAVEKPKRGRPKVSE
jgi:hypothetical protein